MVTSNGALTRRLSGIAAVIGAALALAPAWPAIAQEQKLPTAEKVLDKTILAQGGREAFEKLQSRMSKGTLEISVGQRTMKGTIVRYEADPDLSFVEVKLPGPVIQKFGSDGFVYWEINQPGKTRILEGEEREISARRNRFNAQLHWRDLYEKVECVGKEEFAGRPCVKVVLTPRVGQPVTWYYDWMNGLPLGYEEVRKGEQGDMLVRVQFEDYREVDGVKLPFRQRRSNTGDGQTTTLIYTYEIIEHNKVPAEQFALPEEIKKLRESGEKPPESS